MTISQRIKELRIDRAITKETLAKAIGVSSMAVAFWENGVNEPKAGYIVKLAQYFEVRSDYLLCIPDY